MHTLSPSMEVTIKVVRIRTAERYPVSIPSLVPYDLSTKETRYATLADMWAAISALDHIGKRYPPLPLVATVPIRMATVGGASVLPESQQGKRPNPCRHGGQMSNPWSSHHAPV